MDPIEDTPIPMNKNEKRSSQLPIYKEYFQLLFLEDTAQFYHHEAAAFLAHNSVTEYLKKVYFSLW
jgi:cullin 1